MDYMKKDIQMTEFLIQPKLDVSFCNNCSYSDICELLDPNEGKCRRYEDHMIFCEYQAEGER